MKPSNAFIWLLSVTVLVLTGCYKEKDTGPTFRDPSTKKICAGLMNDQILPVAHGYKWEYDMREQTNMVTPSGSTLEFDTSFYEPIRRGDRTYLYHKSSSMGRLFRGDFMGYDPQGNLMLTYDESTYGVETDEILIPRELYVGKAWRFKSWNTGAYLIYHDSVRVASMNATVETQECTYENLIQLDLYSSADYYLEETYYFKRGLGIIRFIDYDGDWYTKDQELTDIHFD